MSMTATAQWAALPDHSAEIARVREEFITAYGYEPDGVWSAPGRLNLLGEYIDFLGGSCLPMPLPYRTYVAGALRRDGVLRASSLQMPGDERTVVIRDIQPGHLKGWFTYVAGVAWAMNQEGGRDIMLPDEFGADLLINSRVPVGGGLSSSAALECSTALALLELSCPVRDECPEADATPADSDALRARLAQVCITAENKMAGAHTGGLDQTASLRCRQGHALALDCRDMSARQVPFDLSAVGLELLVIDTRAKHSLADGQYGSRRADCEESARILGVGQLVDVEDLDEATAALGNERLAARTRHVVSEIARTRAFIELLDEGPLEGVRLAVAGALLNDSHDSLRDDYEVSCEELDVAVEAARAAGAHGARMTGGGFGGSAIALVDAHAVEGVARAVAAAYAERGWEPPHFIRSLPGAPAGRLD